jgi:hypothetical protein
MILRSLDSDPQILIGKLSQKCLYVTDLRKLGD